MPCEHNIPQKQGDFLTSSRRVLGPADLRDEIITRLSTASGDPAVTPHLDARASQLESLMNIIADIPPESLAAPTADFPKNFKWPKISLVTAVYNGADFLDATICSVLQQGYPNLEYIIVDDGSTDSTPDIIRKYEKYLSYTTRHSNRGLYASLNVGYAQSSGEIMGWLNSSDMLHINSLFVVGSLFAELQKVRWITGRPTVLSRTGLVVEVAPNLPRWSKLPTLLSTNMYVPGLPTSNQYIQQESTFWRRSLWEDAGAALSTDYRAEGDYELWVRFFRHAELYTVEALIGGYRRHEESLSSSNFSRYHRTCESVADREIALTTHGALLRDFKRLTGALRKAPGIRSLWDRIAVRGLYNFLSRSAPPPISYLGDRWVIGKQPESRLDSHCPPIGDQ